MLFWVITYGSISSMFFCCANVVTEKTNTVNSMVLFILFSLFFCEQKNAIKEKEICPIGFIYVVKRQDLVIL